MTQTIAAPAPVPAAQAPQFQNPIILTALIVIVVLGILTQSSSTRLALLFATGTAFGIVLYQSSLGFTGAFRVLLAYGRSAGFRAQMIMLGVACLLFFPALGASAILGQPVVGFVSPADISVAVGSFLFGVGMQLGGGYASGTLFAVGGGNTRMLLTLLFFIVGSVAGVVHLVWWESLPALATVSLIAMLGWPSALFLNIAVFATVYAVVSRIEHRRDGTLEPIATAANGSWRCGPWPLLTGALGLALLDFITLALAGRPWGITSAFGLWGGMALQHAGVSIGNWPGYSAPAMQKALAGILSDATSIMDIGIITSVMLSAALAGKFRLQSRISMRHCGLGARRFVARLWRSAVCCSAMARGWLTAAIPTLFWRHRLRQPAWLDVDRLRPARQLGRSFPASDLRPSGSEPPTTLLKRG